MEILNTLKLKIEAMNQNIIELRKENKSLKFELASINSENNHLLQRSEDMLSSIDKTLTNLKKEKEILDTARSIDE